MRFIFVLSSKDAFVSIKNEAALHQSQAMVPYKLQLAVDTSMVKKGY